MNINIKATNTTVTPAIRANIEEKLMVLDPFLKPEDVVHVELSVDTRHKSGEVQRVEIRITPQGYYAESSENDFYEALDSVLPKIREQLTKTKDKRVSLRRKLGALFKRNR